MIHLSLSHQYITTPLSFLWGHTDALMSPLELAAAVRFNNVFPAHHNTQLSGGRVPEWDCEVYGSAVLKIVQM